LIDLKIGFLRRIVYKRAFMEDRKIDVEMTVIYQTPSATEAELQEYALRLFIRWTLSRKHLLVDEPHCKLLKTFEAGTPTYLKKGKNEL